MRVTDAMSGNVVTVSPETSLKDAAELLAGHQISGLPVVDQENVIGVISEADIVARTTGRRESPGLLREIFAGRKGPDQVEQTRVAEAMTSPAVTIAPDRPVAEAARLMIDKKVNRLPVIEGSHLVGIVTRADLVRAFVRPDEELEHEIRRDVAEGALWIDPSGLEVDVQDGVVTLAGEVERRADAELLERFTQAVPGVVSLQSDLKWRLDEPKVAPSDPRVPPPPAR
ncbi:MAG: CBS domain-containing protein [Gaiellaceae bacterium]